MKKSLQSFPFITLLFFFLLTFNVSLTAQIPCEYCIPNEEWEGFAVYQPSNEVTVDSNIVYATYGERELKLDVYLPKNRRAESTPAILCIHGGGWREGAKDDPGWSQISNKLAEAGFVVASVNYRMSREAIYPAAVKDCRAAVQWLKANADKYGVDKNLIGVMGGSAGGHLSLMMGTSHDSKVFKSEGSVSDVSSQVQAVVAMAPPADFDIFYDFYKSNDNLEGFKTAVQFLGESPEANPELAKEASPTTYVDENSAPTLLVVSTADEIVNYHQGMALMEKYTESRVPIQAHVYSNAPHAFWLFNEWMDENVEMAITFFREQLR